MIESFLLYPDVRSAVHGMLDCLAAAQTDENYFEAGTDVSPEYRILLRGEDGRFLGATPFYGSAAERTAALKCVPKNVREAQVPMKVVKEPRQYCWYVSSGETRLIQSAAFDEEEGAKKDFERVMGTVLAKKAPTSRNTSMLSSRSIHLHGIATCIVPGGRMNQPR